MGGSYTLLRAQKGDTTVAQKNQKADKEVKKEALKWGPTTTTLMAALFPCPLDKWGPWYTPQK
jgi:hypothetical protein